MTCAVNVLKQKKRILICDDDPSVHLAVKYILRDSYDCVTAFNGDEAVTILTNQKFDLIILDLHMRSQGEGLKYLSVLRELDPDIDVIVVSSNTNVELANNVMRSGASAYLIKEHSANQLIITIEGILTKRALAAENLHYVSDRKRGLEKNRILGQSQAVAKLMSDIDKVRRTTANVVITAETGCGKELVARHIGAFDGKPFVAVDSATITSSMAEGILFGHEKGAFTGAHDRQKGLFEEANGGTIYFDEIANMPLEIQVKLLRVFQEKTIMRLGSTKVIPLEFRVICATNQDLERLVSEGKFKDDLYQRLNVINLEIVPLRERQEDIPVLIEHFFEKFRYDNSAKRFSNAALDVLLKYSWPGNVRELANLIANLCAMVVDQEEILVDDLPAKIRRVQNSEQSVSPMSAIADNAVVNKLNQSGLDFFTLMQEVEADTLRRFYQHYNGNISVMSKNLKISRSHLYSKLYTHGIHQQ